MSASTAPLSTAPVSTTPLSSVPTGFKSLNLIEPLCRAVQEEKYFIPTPIQLQAIPPLLEGRDLMGCAQTGTGKTGAFALPILQRLAKKNKAPKPKNVHALVLTPTRELAIQVSDSFRVYGRYLNINHAVVYGGVGYQPQIRALSRGVDVLVATPGRLLDLIQQGHVKLDQVEVFVLDEADRMLDAGFLPVIRNIFAATSERRQTMLFSATVPVEVVQLMKAMLRDPVEVSVTPQSTTVEKIVQRVLFVDRENKSDLLISLLQGSSVTRALVFTRTKHGANKVTQKLAKNRIRAEAIHGNKSQTARMQALKNFRSGKSPVLVATDIAARGLDVDGITHVINYELPNEPESYVHRIGRTARAGASGTAISFCDDGERGYLFNIERVIKQSVTPDAEHPFHADAIASGYKNSSPSSRKKANGNNFGRRQPANSNAKKGRSSSGRGAGFARKTGEQNPSRGNGFGKNRSGRGRAARA